jgi:class 3 adenylate cyclase
VARLDVDGGTPPATDERDDAEREHGAGQPAPPPIAEPGLEPPPPEWTRETVRTFVGLPFMVAHLYARRRGPADAWLPDDDELDLMVGPLLNMANRYAMSRSLARFGDPVAFAAAVGTYSTAESRRIALWRLEHAEGAEPGPDADLGVGLGVHAGDAATPRAWRPPNVPTES